MYTCNNLRTTGSLSLANSTARDKGTGCRNAPKVDLRYRGIHTTDQQLLPRLEMLTRDWRKPARYLGSEIIMDFFMCNSEEQGS